MRPLPEPALRWDNPARRRRAKPRAWKAPGREAFVEPWHRRRRRAARCRARAADRFLRQCRLARAGFQSGLRRAIGDGCPGFGLRGEAQRPNPAYAADEFDVQALPSPKALRVGCQANLLWMDLYRFKTPQL